MISIDQLLESVDLDFEPRFVTQNKSGTVELWKTEPTKTDSGYWCNPPSRIIYFSRLKLAEFENKPWAECIYEVPRKTTGEIEKLTEASIGKDGDVPSLTSTVNVLNIIINRLNQVIDAVNELKGAKNE